MEYRGEDVATTGLVRRFLADNYTAADGTALAEADLDALLTKHEAIVTDGISSASFAYFVGDKIAEAEGLVAVDDEDDEIDDASEIDGAGEDGGSGTR